MAEDIKIIDDLWILPTAEGYKVGLTSQAQEDLGTMTFATFPKVGQELSKGDSLLEVEAEKAVSEFSMPFNGTIVAVNGAAVADLSVLEDKDQTNAWVAVLAPVTEEEMVQL